MKVILIEKVPSLGNIGEIVKVKAGHARNFLFPKKLAVLADEGQMAQIENQKKKLKKRVDAEMNNALSLKKQIEGLDLEFIKRVGSNGKLFGAVTGFEIVKEFENKGISGVERRLVVLDTPIKGLGKFTAKVKLFTGVEAKLKVSVVMDPRQVEELKEREKQGAKKKQAKKTDVDKDGASLENVDSLDDSVLASDDSSISDVKKTTSKASSVASDVKKTTSKALKADDDKNEKTVKVSAKSTEKKAGKTVALKDKATKKAIKKSDD